jgi:hypothetical protein
VTELTGRHAERDVLDRLVAAVRAGESRTLVVRGEPGVGKTALLEFLPAPQRDALRIGFGLTAGPAPDRFLIGLAALGLLSELAGEQPLVCIVDDEQWLDSASAQVLAFLARRLGTESVGLVFGARIPTCDLAGAPELVVGGLRENDARALLNSALTGPLDGRVCDQIIAEAHGNPLALLELPRGWTADPGRPGAGRRRCWGAGALGRPGAGAGRAGRGGRLR